MLLLKSCLINVPFVQCLPLTPHEYGMDSHSLKSMLPVFFPKPHPPSLYHFHASWLYVGFHSQQPAPTSLSPLTTLRQLEPDLPRDMESWKCLGVYIPWEQPLTSDWQWRELIFQLPCPPMGTILRCVFHCLHNSPLRLNQSNIPWNFAFCRTLAWPPFFLVPFLLLPTAFS